MGASRGDTAVAGRFAGKVAIVTGAGSGIGRATVLAFAKAGGNVYFGDINEKGADARFVKVERGQFAAKK